MISDNKMEPLKVQDAPEIKKMSAAEFVKYAADNHIKFTLPEDNRKYPHQQCQDEKLNIAFRHLHEHLVNETIQFCRAYGITIDEFHLNADCLEESIKHGSWQPCTDSCLSFDKYSQEYKDIISMKKVVSNDEYNKIFANKEPFMISM